MNQSVSARVKHGLLYRWMCAVWLRFFDASRAYITLQQVTAILMSTVVAGSVKAGVLTGR